MHAGNGFTKFSFTFSFRSSNIFLPVFSKKNPNLKQRKEITCPTSRPISLEALKE